MPKLSLLEHAVASQTPSTNVKVTDSYTLKWSQFVQTLDAALDLSEDTIRRDKTVIVMRQAPQQFTLILKHEPSKMLGNLLKFLVVATSRRPGISDNELQVFLRIVKSLLNFGASVMPTANPSHNLLRSVARWDSDDMSNFARNTSATCLHNILGQFYPPGSKARAILFQEVIANQSSSFAAPLSEPQGEKAETRIDKYDDWLAKTMLAG